jgi:hypothetical protein
MGDELSRAEFLAHIGYLREDVAGITTRLDRLNGKTDTHSQKIAVLEDRADEARDVARAEAKKAGGRWGAVGMFGGGVIVAIYQYFGGAK